MANRITSVHFHLSRFDPVEAELAVSVGCERLLSMTQVKGRLVGPRCPYASTVEVAYDFRELSRTYESEGLPKISLRAIIPEPSPWDPEGPFLYEGYLELWEPGTRCDRTVISQAIRTVSFGQKGWRWNGRELRLCGRRCESLSEADARQLHQEGVNLLLMRVDENSREYWKIADRFGFLMLGRIDSPQAFGQRAELARHACALGWVLTKEILEHPLVQACGVQYFRDLEIPVGLELQGPPGLQVPDGVEFIVVSERRAEAFLEVALPTVALPSDLGEPGA